jgi:hypothetical protein
MSPQKQAAATGQQPVAKQAAGGRNPRTVNRKAPAKAGAFLFLTLHYQNTKFGLKTCQICWVLLAWKWFVISCLPFWEGCGA